MFGRFTGSLLLLIVFIATREAVVAVSCLGKYGLICGDCNTQWVRVSESPSEQQDHNPPLYDIIGRRVLDWRIRQTSEHARRNIPDDHIAYKMSVLTFHRPTILSAQVEISALPSVFSPIQMTVHSISHVRRLVNIPFCTLVEREKCSMHRQISANDEFGQPIVRFRVVISKRVNLWHIRPKRLCIRCACSAVWASKRSCSVAITRAAMNSTRSHSVVSRNAHLLVVSRIQKIARRIMFAIAVEFVY